MNAIWIIESAANMWKVSKLFTFFELNFIVLNKIGQPDVLVFHCFQLYRLFFFKFYWLVVVVPEMQKKNIASPLCSDAFHVDRFLLMFYSYQWTLSATKTTEKDTHTHRSDWIGSFHFNFFFITLARSFKLLLCYDLVTRYRPNTN